MDQDYAGKCRKLRIVQTVQIGRLQITSQKRALEFDQLTICLSILLLFEGAMTENLFF